ncbi:MAG: hypothetical protein Q6373_021490 [Candidatus Sigynarchaeota archaeon]
MAHVDERKYWKRTQIAGWAGVLWKLTSARQRIAARKPTEKEMDEYIDMDDLEINEKVHFVPEYASLFRRGEGDERPTSGDWVALVETFVDEGKGHYITERFTDEEWRQFPIIPWENVPDIVWEGLAATVAEYESDVSIEILINRIARANYEKWHEIDEDLLDAIDELDPDPFFSLATEAFIRIVNALESRGLLRETCQVLVYHISYSLLHRYPGLGDYLPYWNKLEAFLDKIGDLDFSKHVWLDIYRQLSIIEETRPQAIEAEKKAEAIEELIKKRQ